MNLVGKLHIDGLFDGRISSVDSITVGSRGQVSGVVRADKISVSGRVNADIHCGELTIESGGHVCGVVHSRLMTIHKQGSFIGQRALTTDSSLVSPEQLESQQGDDVPHDLVLASIDHTVAEQPETSPDVLVDSPQEPEHLTRMLESMLGEVPSVGGSRAGKKNHNPDVGRSGKVAKYAKR
ncbi:MAG: polymer-forming cytoskeletal protein [Motiliproteus sp.]